MAALERVKKDKLALVCRLKSELHRAKKALKEVKDECQTLQIKSTQLERKKSKSAVEDDIPSGDDRKQTRVKKAKTAVLVDITSDDNVHPTRVVRAKKGKITRRGDRSNKMFYNSLMHLQRINLFLAF